ncbi:hypothetical protein GCM10010452_03240 [Crossiella cryophila]
MSSGPESSTSVPPLAACPAIRTSSVVYGLSVLDHRGRVTDLVVLRALDWTPGTRLRLREVGGLLAVEAHAEGALSVTKQGHFRIPAATRHRHRLATGDRVVLAAAPAAGRVFVLSLVVLDELFTNRFAAAVGGDSW